MSNKNDTTLYVGATEDLVSRVIQHKEKHFPNSFTARYKLFKLVYFEVYGSIEEAIDEEKKLKKKNRKFKDDLINKKNPSRIDLWELEVQYWNLK